MYKFPFRHNPKVPTEYEPILVLVPVPVYPTVPPDVSNIEYDASVNNAAYDASIVLQSPSRELHVGYLTGDGIPPNGAPFGQGISFPSNPINGQFYLRTDYLPNRLFRYDGIHWIKHEDNVRMTTSMLGESQTSNPLLVRRKLKASFINNETTGTIAGVVVPERQALSQVLKPRADL